MVHDDPAFGAEPMLRASEVTASLRLTSLFRGRLEISRLVLTEPSLNLVQMARAIGTWNIFWNVHLDAVAPTGKRCVSARPGFPYIEADRGRINFKIGQEKMPFALSEADYAFGRTPKAPGACG